MIEEGELLSMISNLLKSLYLFIVKIRSDITFKKHEKVIFLLSFPSTSGIVIEAIYNEWGKNLIICYTSEASGLAYEYKKKGCIIYPIDSFKTLIHRVVPLVTAAKVVLCDNYFAFLGSIRSSNDREIVQIWHANGAIKYFGLEARYTQNCSKIDQNRYKRVYEKFTHYIVSSDKMSEIFTRNYQVTINTLPFGYPMTDNYFDPDWIHEKKNLFKQNFPTSKKVLLYAPTYREENSKITNKFNKIVDDLQEDWIILVKPHPHEEGKYRSLNHEDKMFLDFKGLSLTEILPSVDCLITDYSSIPFEYSLANTNGRVIFYCYDFLEYDRMVGIEKDFKEWAPGDIVFDEKSLLEAINAEKETSFDKFNADWNQFANGTSRKRIIEWVRNKNES